MQLLLFLSALLAGLTGAFAGDRATRVAGQHNETAITRAAEAAAETVVAVAEIRAAVLSVAAVPGAIRAFAVHDVPTALPIRLTTGRWLE